MLTKFETPQQSYDINFTDCQNDEIQTYNNGKNSNLQSAYVSTLGNSTVGNSTHNNSCLSSNFQTSNFYHRRSISENNPFNEKVYIDLNKKEGRTPLFFSKLKTNIDKFYNANHNLQKQREDTHCIGFQKTPAKFENYNSRTGVMKKTYSNKPILSNLNNPEIIGEKFRSKSLTKHIMFNKGPGKNLNPNSHLPLWMQKKSGTRMDLNIINEKSFDQNKYTDGSFYSRYDGFSPKKPTKINKISK